MSGSAALVVNGWTLFAHSIFLDQVEALSAQIEALKRKDLAGYPSKNATRRMAAIAKLAFEVIPQDPSRPDYRHGGTLGDEDRHWFRAKFFRQYRLFFRFHLQAKVIVFAWVNNEGTKRATRVPTTPTGSSAACLTGAACPRTGVNCWPKRVLSRSGRVGWRQALADDAGSGTQLFSSADAVR